MSRRGVPDSDQYSVRVASLYFEKREGNTYEDFLTKMRSVRTVSFKNAPTVDRSKFEKLLLKQLDGKFTKKKWSDFQFPGGVHSERAKLCRKRASIGKIVASFKDAVEARAIDSFWESRKKGSLRSGPEKIAQGLFATFLYGVLKDRGLVVRELSSGIGFVDFAVLLTNVPHLVEMKVLTSKFTGVSQIATYMQNEKRQEGWLLVVDARPVNQRNENPQEKINLPQGTVRVVTIDINPDVPSKKS